MQIGIISMVLVFVVASIVVIGLAFAIGAFLQDVSGRAEV